MDFKSLSVLLPEQIRILIDELLSIKVKVDESFMIEKKSEINAFVGESIRYCEGRIPVAKTADNEVELNKLFKRSIA